MIELEKNAFIKESNKLIQLKGFGGNSVYITDPEGQKIEFKSREDGTTLVCTVDENGKNIGIEERTNGTKVYHIEADSSGLPSSHEIRSDLTEIVYFYNINGGLEHFVELKTNGDRISTVIDQDGGLYSVDQKQIGGIVFQGWMNNEEGMIWLHPDGELSTHGDDSVLQKLRSKFKIFLDGVSV